MELVVVGGSDAGISAGLRARELDPSCAVTVIVADAYPNFSICGIPYLVSGDVADWRTLAHRSHADLEAAGLRLRLDTRVTSVDPQRRELTVAIAENVREIVPYDALVVGTGAVPLVPPIDGLTGPDGRSTNAVYGFSTMLRKLIADHKPEFIAASFDLAGPTFRDELASDYKANRAPMPPDLAAAYACQDAAIELVKDAIAGWKVGLIGKDAAAVFKQDRLAGPIFASSVRESRGGEFVGFPVFGGGFAAVEAEFLLRLGRDAPAGQREWTRAQARELVADVHVGVETAGSPLATINDLGPTAIVADFGNNAGLIVGPKLRNWRTTPVESWRCETFVDGTAVGSGHAGLPPGGPAPLTWPGQKNGPQPRTKRGFFARRAG